MVNVKNHIKELLRVFQKGLRFVNIKDKVILKPLKAIKPEGMSSRIKSSISFAPDLFMTQGRSPVSSKPDALLHGTSSVNPARQEKLLSRKKSSTSLKQDGLFIGTESSARAPKARDWDLLIDSYNSHYRLARWFFQTSYYRRLGEYLISEGYKPWSKDSTWRHVGLTNDSNVEKKVRHAEALFLEWGFIKKTDGDKFSRVEGCSSYLKRLLEKDASQ